MTVIEHYERLRSLHIAEPCLDDAAYLDQLRIGQREKVQLVESGERKNSPDVEPLVVHFARAVDQAQCVVDVGVVDWYSLQFVCYDVCIRPSCLNDS